MINAIKNLLLEFNYGIDFETRNSVFAYNLSKTKKDYYFIFDLGEFKSIELLNRKVEVTENMFINREITFEDSSKNTTAIYLINIEQQFLTDKLKSFIYELEETPYYMKRNVLYYTKKELEYILKCTEERRLKDTVLKKIKDNELFNCFKHNKEGNEIYSIISKLFIKFNCFNYPFESNKEFTHLLNSIRESAYLNNEIGKVYFDKILDGLDSIIEDNLKFEEFYTLISNEIETSMDKGIDSLINEKIIEMSKKL